MGPLVPGQSRAGWKTPVVWKNTGRVQKPGKHPPDSGWTTPQREALSMTRSSINHNPKIAVLVLFPVAALAMHTKGEVDPEQDVAQPSSCIDGDAQVQTAHRSLAGLFERIFTHWRIHQLSMRYVGWLGVVLQADGFPYRKVSLVLDIVFGQLHQL